MAPPIEKGYLLLADISGFTQFLVDTELDHAPVIVGNIVSFLTNHLTPTLDVIEIEGDAVFAAAPSSRFSRGELLLELVESTYAAFRDHQRTLTYNITCGCMACQAVPTLNLKFVAHHGEYVMQELAGKLKPVGTSVNLAHRLLKNGVVSDTGWNAYCLFTKPCIEAMRTCPDGMHKRKEVYPHIGEIATSSLNLDESYRRMDDDRIVRVDKDEADVCISIDFGGPPPIIWDWLSDPQKRNLWFEGADWQQRTRPSGRTERYAQNHCTNSKIVEHILDWRPFDYYTVRYRRPPMDVTVTADLKARGTGTTLEWKMRMNSALPATIRKRLARLMARHAFRVEGTMAVLDRLSRAAMDRGGRPLITENREPRTEN